MGPSRRDLLRAVAVATAAAALPRALSAVAGPPNARVLVVRERDRARAVEAALETTQFRACAGRPVAVKANFNSADAFPASTHPATLAALLAGVTSRGATSVTLAERSGMGDTRRVLRTTGAADALRDAGARMVVLDDVERTAWQPFRSEHWPRGFHAARVFTETPCVVQTMCCKTHRFGGHVTLSLKNTVGLVAKTLPGEGHDYMSDLHRSPNQRAMIAEANLAWRPALNVMDCLEAFIDGGPEQGTRVAPGVFLVSEDRCALDAAAIALLRLHGLRGPAARGKIADTDQLSRAIALGIGVAPSQVTVVPASPDARDVARRLADLLAAG